MKRWLRQVLIRNLPLLGREADLLPRGGRYALVGSTGSGKTTTLAKLAARGVDALGAGEVALVAADAYRIGAAAQLTVYADLLGVSLHVAEDMDRLARLLPHLADKKLVLIDTAGFAPNDPRTREGQALDTLGVRRLAVISAAQQGAAIEQAMTRFGQGAAACILTKLDETPVKQLSAIRGLVVDPLGKIVELPIKSNFRNGLSAFEYVTSSRGSRKGLTDTALKTADAGYLTRRLVDVAHDVIIRLEDCGTKEGHVLSRSNRTSSFTANILGRVAAEDIKSADGKRIIVASGAMIDMSKLPEIDAENIESVKVFSPLTCASRYGICAKCYGWDLSRNDNKSIRCLKNYLIPLLLFPHTPNRIAFDALLL